MAAEYVIPGSGIVNDTEEDSEVVIPGSGLYNEQVAAVGGEVIPLLMANSLGGNMLGGNCNLM